MEHGLLYSSTKIAFSRNQVLFTLRNTAVAVCSSTCHMLRIIARTSHAYAMPLHTHQSGPHKHLLCATAVVPWLPQSRELESVRHGVIQTTRYGSSSKQSKENKQTPICGVGTSLARTSST